MRRRRAFLVRLFEILEQRAVPYCVLRNYENVYEDDTSDLDVAVDQQDLGRFDACLAEAAAASGCRLIHQARYTNFSFVYQHAGGPFVRVDVETEVRWRCFPVLSAREVIASRRRHGGFYVPEPRHESVVLFVAAVWRSRLRERNERRLAVLAGEIGDVELGGALGECFGKAGRELERVQRGAAAAPLNPKFWRAVKRSIILGTFGSARKMRALFGYVVEDVGRYWRRLRNPPGISLLCVRSAGVPEEMDEVFKRMEFLFPVKKSVKCSFKVGSEEGDILRPGWGLRWRRLCTVFKGGIFAACYEVRDDAEVRKAGRALCRARYPSRFFLVAEMSGGCCLMSDPQAGFTMSCLPETRHSELVQFIASRLAGERAEKCGFQIR